MAAGCGIFGNRYVRVLGRMAIMAYSTQQVVIMVQVHLGLSFSKQGRRESYCLIERQKKLNTSYKIAKEHRSIF